MLYLATASTERVRDAMRAGHLGQITGPGSNRVVPGVPFALDNGTVRVVDGHPVRDPDWNPERWARWLDRQPRDRCLFAVVPDWVGDPDRTDDLWHRYAPVVRALGFPTAYAIQNRCAATPPDCDVVFVGGDNQWKESVAALDLAVRSGKPRHMGRVNTKRRLRLAGRDGYDTVDGTFLGFGPDANLPRLLRYLRAANHPTLFSHG